MLFHLGKIKAHSEAFSVYSMLKYSKRTMCKAFHEKILHILIAGKLLKDAYVVVKVCYTVLEINWIHARSVLVLIVFLKLLLRIMQNLSLQLQLRSLQNHL